MTAPVRPRRSVLYMPGSNARALEKARTLPADALILDLEDAVAPAAKDEARAQIVAALAGGGYGAREIIVRINGLETEWGGADMAAIAETAADAILIPKVEGKAMVAEVERAMEKAGARPQMAIWCMMETALGVLRAEEIAGSSDRIAALVMGTSDLSKDLHCLHTPMRLRLSPASIFVSLRRVPTASRSSTGYTSISPTPRASPKSACKGASSASTARP